MLLVNTHHVAECRALDVVLGNSQQCYWRSTRHKESAMPGGFVGKKIDTSNWGVKEWRFAFFWNLGFFVLWVTFFTFGAIDAISNGDWSMIVFVLIIASVGVVIQLNWLIRCGIWLLKHRVSK